MRAQPFDRKEWARRPHTERTRIPRRTPAALMATLFVLTSLSAVIWIPTASAADDDLNLSGLGLRSDGSFSPCGPEVEFAVWVNDTLGTWNRHPPTAL